MSDHRPRLYVKLAPGDSAETRLDAALGGTLVEAVLISGGGSGNNLRRLVSIAQARNAAALIEADAALALDLSADGVHLPWTETLEADYAAARRLLGKDRIIGVDAGASRHDAMTLGETGADYVAFVHATGADGMPADQLDLVSWWSELFEVPCVAIGVSEAAAAAELAAAGADFIGIDLPAGLTAEQTAAHVRRIGDAIALPYAAAAVRGEA